MPDLSQLDGIITKINVIMNIFRLIAESDRRLLSSRSSAFVIIKTNNGNYRGAARASWTGQTKETTTHIRTLDIKSIGKEHGTQLPVWSDHYGHQSRASSMLYKNICQFVFSYAS